MNAVDRCVWVLERSLTHAGGAVVAQLRDRVSPAHILMLAAGALVGLSPAGWIGRAAGVALTGGQVLMLLNRLRSVIVDALHAHTVNELRRASAELTQIEGEAGAGFVAWALGASIGRAIRGAVSARQARSQQAMAPVPRPQRAFTPGSDPPGVVFNQSGATSGQFAGLNTIEQVNERVRTLRSLGKFKRIGEDSGSNKVYEELRPDGKPNGYVYRIGEISRVEVRAAIAASRLGVGPKIAVEDSWFGGPTQGLGEGVLRMERIRGMTLREWRDTPEAKGLAGTQVTRDLAQKVAQLHGHGWIHGDLHEGNVLIAQGTHAVKIIDYTKATHLSDDKSGMFNDLKRVFMRAKELKPAAVSMEAWMQTIQHAYLDALDHIGSASATKAKRMAQEMFTWDVFNRGTWSPSDGTTLPQ